jgi:hypothetical protein
MPQRLGVMFIRTPSALLRINIAESIRNNAKNFSNYVILNFTKICEAH